jgi:branched-chain amino acid aminotransferase
VIVWLNGALIDADAARLDPTDRGFTLGDGLFETIRIATGRPAHLDRHLARLRGGAEFLGIPVPSADDDIAAAISSLLAAEGLSEAAVRITLSRGPAARGVLPPARPVPTLLITVGPLPPAAAPAHVIIATVTRRNEASPLSRFKSLNYLDNILARQEAVRHGADDAVLLNVAGRIAEATAANLFVLAKDVLRTPPIADGALPGIMRSLLIERRGAVEASLTPADLMAAETAFLSNSLGLRRIAAVDGQRLRHDIDEHVIEELARCLD